MEKTIIDFHTHILPRMDHGSGSQEETERQIGILRDAGVKTIVATPHFYPAAITVRRFLELRERSAKEMQEILGENAPEVYLGAEIMISPHLDRMPELESLTIRGTNVFLAEFPPGKIEESLIDTIVRIRESGFKVVIAHVDRYKAEDMENLLEMGFCGQVNAEAFALKNICIHFRLKKWVDRGYIWAVGSDLHGCSGKYIRWIKRMKKVLGGERMEKICENTRELLQGAIHAAEIRGNQTELPTP